MSYSIYDNDDELLQLDIPEELEKLAKLERVFLLEYFKDMNATASYRRLQQNYDGLVSKTNPPTAGGYYIVNKPHVKRVAKAYIRQKLYAQDLSVSRVLTELGTLATANITHYVSWKGNKVVIKDVADIPEDLTPAIKRITRIDNPSGSRLEIELHDKLKALELLGKYHSIFQERVKVDADVRIGGVLRVPTVQSEEEWENADNEG